MNDAISFAIPVGLYLILQVGAGIRCRGRLRVAALVPLAWMLPLTAFTVKWFIEGSNFAPCLWIPVAVGTGAFLLCILVAALSRPEPEPHGFETLPPRR
jgi:hypothetical protein